MKLVREQIRNNYWDLLHHRAYNQVSIVWDQIYDQIYDQIWEIVWRQFYFNIINQAKKINELSKNTY